MDTQEVGSATSARFLSFRIVAAGGTTAVPNKVVQKAALKKDKKNTP
ncbi:hypothetical protein ABZV93_17450 [Actinopolymorpha sp. NPDC004070]